MNATLGQHLQSMFKVQQNKYSMRLQQFQLSCFKAYNAVLFRKTNEDNLCNKGL